VYQPFKDGNPSPHWRDPDRYNQSLRQQFRAMKAHYTSPYQFSIKRFDGPSAPLVREKFHFDSKKNKRNASFQWKLAQRKQTFSF